MERALNRSVADNFRDIIFAPRATFGDMPALLWGQVANTSFFSIWYSVLVALAAVHALKASRGAAYALGVAVFVISGFLTALGPS